MMRFKFLPAVVFSLCLVFTASCGKKKAEDNNQAFNGIAPISVPYFPMPTMPPAGDYNQYCTQIGGTIVNVSGTSACKVSYNVFNANGWYCFGTCSNSFGQIAVGDSVTITKSGTLGYVAVGGSQISGSPTTFVSPYSGPLSLGSGGFFDKLKVQSVSLTRCQAQNGQTFYCP